MKDNEKMTVKEGLEKEYESYVEKNSKDDYSNACIVAGAKVGKALDKGKSLKDSHDEMYGEDLSGFMAGCVARAISHFHPRGNEFRIWWNEQHGVKEDRAKGGVVNPAIMTIGGK